VWSIGRKASSRKARRTPRSDRIRIAACSRGRLRHSCSGLSVARTIEMQGGARTVKRFVEISGPYRPPWPRKRGKLCARDWSGVPRIGVPTQSAAGETRKTKRRLRGSGGGWGGGVGGGGGGGVGDRALAANYARLVVEEQPDEAAGRPTARSRRAPTGRPALGSSRPTIRRKRRRVSSAAGAADLDRRYEGRRSAPEQVRSDQRIV